MSYQAALGMDICSIGEQGLHHLHVVVLSSAMQGCQALQQSAMQHHASLAVGKSLVLHGNKRMHHVPDCKAVKPIPMVVVLR